MTRETTTTACSKKAQSAYYTAKIHEYKKKPKDLQRIYNTILHRNREAKLPTFSNAQDLANKFGDFFTDKIDKIRADLPVLPSSPSDHDFEPVAENAHLHILDPVNELHLRKLINQSPTKTCDLDPLPTSLLKGNVESLLSLIVLTVNKSLTSGVVPDSMKLALVTPIIKKPSLDPETFANYRPVSNLSFLSKVLERVVAAKVNSYMEKHNLHDVMQSAYKSKHSTETALLRVQNDIRCMLDKGAAVILVLLDLSAAFDTVDHSVPLYRMKCIGFDGSALKWFESYLSGRMQYVTIQGQRSTPRPLKCGVPQGSVLGPLLFLIYVLPLGRLIHAHDFPRHGFADDNQVYRAFYEISDILAVRSGCRRVEVCLSSIQAWLTKNFLKGNPAKTEIQLFGTPQRLIKLCIESLSVDGVEVRVATGPVRNLGVMFDSTLSMASQVNNMVSSGYFHLKNIAHARNMLTRDATRTLVQALVISRLDYSNGVLLNISGELISKLQSVQNRAARLVSLTRKRDHITPVLRNLHWLPIKARVEYKTLNLVFKCLHNLAPEYLSELLQPYTPTRLLRSADKNLLTAPRYISSSFGGRAFSCAAPRLWNSLDPTLRQIDNLDCFLKALKTELFKCYL